MVATESGPEWAQGEGLTTPLADRVPWSGEGCLYPQRRNSVLGTTATRIPATLLTISRSLIQTDGASLSMIKRMADNQVRALLKQLKRDKELGQALKCAGNAEAAITIARAAGFEVSRSDFANYEEFDADLEDLWASWHPKKA